MITVVNKATGSTISVMPTNSSIKVANVQGMSANRAGNVVVNSTVRGGGAGEVYKVATDTVVIQKDTLEDTYYVMTKNEISGQPINVFIHYSDDDVQVFSQFSIAGRKASFNFEDDISALNCSLTYMYSVI